MTCEEFQHVLPFIIESGGNAEEEEHLRTCKVCSDLVADLKYIADQAKLLVPMEDPSPKVWEGIEKELEREGLVRPTGHRRGLLARTRWGAVHWLGVPVLLAMALVAGLIQRSHRAGENTGFQAAAASITTPGITDEDRQLLAQVDATAPSLRSNYEENLRTINAHIAGARQRLAQAPDDNVARQFLMQAYEQKDILYHMALARSEP